MTSISSELYLQPASPTKVTTSSDNSYLGKDAFLQILIAQLQNQDPTDPMDDKEFISQMAQFSSLEQMQNMTTAMENLLTSQEETQLMSYTNFVGKDVKWHEATNELDTTGDPIYNEGKGRVKEIKFAKGTPVFVLEDGKELSAGNISSVLANDSSTSTSSETNPLVAASQLIGSAVKYSGENGDAESSIESIVNSS